MGASQVIGGLCEKWTPLIVSAGQHKDGHFLRRDTYDGTP
jgi:hypothetical protein